MVGRAGFAQTRHSFHFLRLAFWGVVTATLAKQTFATLINLVFVAPFPRDLRGRTMDCGVETRVQSR